MLVPPSVPNDARCDQPAAGPQRGHPAEHGRHREERDQAEQEEDERAEVEVPHRYSLAPLAARSPISSTLTPYVASTAALPRSQSLDRRPDLASTRAVNLWSDSGPFTA